LNELYEKGIEYGTITLVNAYIALKVVKAAISIIKDGIFVYETANRAKSFMGIKCKIGRHIVATFGRSYKVLPFDTILTSATQKTIEDTLLAKKEWGEIPIARAKYPFIENVALFVKAPVGAIKWKGKVKRIKYNSSTKKSTIILDGEPEEIDPIRFDERWPQHNGHGTVYTTLERIKKARTLCDVYPSLE